MTPPESRDRESGLHDQHHTEEQVVTLEMCAGEGAADPPDRDREQADGACKDKRSQRHWRTRQGDGRQRHRALRDEHDREREPDGHVGAGWFENEQRQTEITGGDHRRRAADRQRALQHGGQLTTRLSAA